MRQRGFLRSDKRFTVRFGAVAPTEEGMTVDLSHKGLCFRCDELPKSPEIVIHLDAGQETLELIARRRWSKEVMRLNQQRFQVGVEVVQAPRSYHRLVQKLVYH